MRVFYRRIGIIVLLGVGITIGIVAIVAVVNTADRSRSAPADAVKSTGNFAQQLHAALKEPPLDVPRLLIGHDKDRDGIDDLDDIVRGARAEAHRRPTYKSAYYRGGYPPENEGVCTDVIWRAFKDAGYDLKAIVDSDISHHISSYPRVEGKPDPNIDFRRVPNLESFFKRHATLLTVEIKPGDTQNLKLWQGGDIVVFGKPLPHIAIISDKRRNDGVPLLIHNAGPCAVENDYLLSWPSPITHHFRFPIAPPAAPEE